MDNNIEKLTQELIEYSGTYVYPEYYSHTGCKMWKINNPWTKYKEEKIVLCPVDGESQLEKALVLALAILAKKYDEFLGK